MLAQIELIFTAIFNFAVAAAPYVALYAGLSYYQTQQAKKEASRQRKGQIAAGKVQAEAAGRQRAIQQAPISAEQMQIFRGAQEIENLTEKLLAQDQREPRILTLPTSREPPGLVERINLGIDRALRA